jgi:hypothetical protein
MRDKVGALGASVGICTSIMISIMLLILPFASTAAASTNTSPSTNPPQALVPSTPMPDDQVGCYDYTNSTGWQSVPCAPAATSASFQFTEGGGTYGVNGIYNSGPQLISTYVDVGFSTFSGEHDSYFGNEAWSIQANTNAFPGSNGHSDLDQFVYFNWPNYLPFIGEAGVCISQNILSGAYTNACNMWYLNTQVLSTSINDQVSGWTSTSGGTAYVNAQFCTTTQCWGETQTDLYGLGVSGNWLEGSGTILGMRGAQTAIFTSPTSENTIVGVASGTTISGSTAVSYFTGEMNNLNTGTTSFGCTNAGGLHFCTYSTNSYN